MFTSRIHSDIVEMIEFFMCGVISDNFKLSTSFVVEFFLNGLFLFSFLAKCKKIFIHEFCVDTPRIFDLWTKINTDFSRHMENLWELTFDFLSGIFYVRTFFRQVLVDFNSVSIGDGHFSRELIELSSGELVKYFEERIK